VGEWVGAFVVSVSGSADSPGNLNGEEGRGGRLLSRMAAWWMKQI
jgi:hypothetical protein